MNRNETYRYVFGNKFASVAVKNLIDNTCTKRAHTDKQKLDRVFLQMFNKGTIEYEEILQLAELIK